jgi:hypothetical protein
MRIVRIKGFIWLNVEAMRDKSTSPSHRDPLPQSFSTLDEAGEFWDTHSSADYESEMEDVDVEVDLSEELVARVKEEAPLVLTVAGEAKLVVQEADAYMNLLQRAKQQETVEALRVGIRAADEGRMRPLEEALADLKQRHGIPD